MSSTQRAGEAVSYTFDALAGTTYLIEVAQRGLDFTVTVDGGGATRSFNSPLKRDEAELVIVEATQAERFRVTLAAEEPTDASGEHAIRLRVVDERSATDSLWKAAWLLMSNAAAANAVGDRANAEQARNWYWATASLWAQLGQPRLQAQALYSVGMVEYHGLENWNGAIENADKAAALYRDLDEKLYANTLFLRAYALIETASEFEAATKESVFQRALATFDEVLRIHDALGNDFEKAHVLNYTGVARWNRANRALDDWVAARNYYNESAAIFSRLGEWREELNCLQNKVVLDNAEGRSLEAIASFERILERLPPERDPKLRASILANLGNAHMAFGNVDDALQLQTESHALYASIQDRTGQGYALKNLGETYFSFGDFGRAKQYLEQAQTFAEGANDFRTQATIQSSLGNVAFAESDFAAALERHQRAVELSTSAEERARRLLLLGKDLAALHRHDDAITAASTARNESRSEVVRADALLQTGVSYVALGDTVRAIPALDEAKTAYETLQLTARLGDALHAYSLAARANGDQASAVTYGRMALEKIEGLRERVAHPELRALNSAARRRYYEDQIDLLMELHGASGTEESEYLLEALSIDERSRARLTLDLLGEATVDLYRDMEPEIAARRRALYASLAEKRQQQERPNSRDIADKVAFEMRDIENELALLETDYRRGHPVSSHLGSERVLDATEVQAAVGPDAVLLQYTLGETRSYVWAVTSESIRGFGLPGRAVIEDVARAVHSDLGKLPSSRLNSRLAANLTLLSGYLLNDVAGIVAAKPRVLVAADGALQYIPFGVLPAFAADTDRPTPLVSSTEIREIVTIASISARSAGQRDEAASATPSVAVFADPVMEEADARFASNGAETSASEINAPFPATRSSTGPSLSRLPYTGREARAIADLLPNAANLVAVGFDANLDAVLGKDLRQYRYIHFATHGIVDSQRPALSALALSQFDDQRRRRAGYLRLYDIYTLELNADVVVLSACDTGLGRAIRGESLVGLTQGFLYAGARNVVASLWQVPDNATSALMTRFYRLLLSGDRSPAQALAAAQRSLATERATSDPYYWGAFVIQER
jgi:CHAT domain-containing protein